MTPCWWRRRWPLSLSPSPNVFSKLRTICVCPHVSKTVLPITFIHDCHIKSEFCKIRSEHIYKCQSYISTYSLRFVSLCPAPYVDCHISSESGKIKRDRMDRCHLNISFYSLKTVISCCASYAEVSELNIRRSLCTFHSVYISCACP
jgi:hypothetical protein